MLEIERSLCEGCKVPQRIQPDEDFSVAELRRAIGDVLDGGEGRVPLSTAVSYFAFDLEATRRENSYLRKMLESRGGERD